MGNTLSLAQRLVGGRDDAHVHRDAARAAHAFDLALLQRTQQLALCDKTQAANFIEKQGAAAGPLEAAGPGNTGPGVGAALHTKQLGLDQGLGNRGAVHRDKRLVLARADLVQHAGKFLLADAGLAGEEHGGGGARHPAQLVASRVEGRRGAHHRVTRRRGGFGQVGGARGRARVGGGVDKFAGVEVAHVFLDVVPLVGGFAHDTAVRLAHGAALDFPKDDEVTQERADIAGGVTHLHPAGGRAANAVGGDVLVVFTGVMPQEFTFVAASVGVVGRTHQLDLHHAFERMQAGAGDGGGQRVGLGPLLAHQLGVAGTADVTGAGEQAARLLLPKAVDHLAPQRAQGFRVHEDHALVLQPDASVAGREKKALAHVRDGGMPIARHLRAGKATQRFGHGGHIEIAQGGAGGTRHFGKGNAGRSAHGFAQ